MTKWYDPPPRDAVRSEVNQRLLGGLFIEWRARPSSQGVRADRHFSKKPPIFNLTDDQEIDGTIPLKALFMQYPTEYDFAVAVFGQWAHWQAIKDSKWFQKYYKEWDRERKEMEVARARKTLLDKMADGDVAAAKKIIDEAKPRAAVGRKTKEEVKRQAREIAEEDKLLDHAKALIN